MTEIEVNKRKYTTETVDVNFPVYRESGEMQFETLESRNLQRVGNKLESTQ